MTRPTLAPLSCPAYALVGWYWDGRSGADAHRVLFARDCGDGWTDLMAYEPGWHSLVPVRDLEPSNGALVVLFDPSPAELAEGLALVEAEARRKVEAEARSSIPAPHLTRVEAARP